MMEKKNAFDLLRLILASCVLITHSLLLGGYQLLDPLAVLSKNQTSLADFGVMGFFALSGYLITASFQRTKNPFIFVSHRLLRIFPGFWVCLIISALVFAPLIFFANTSKIAGFDFTGREGAFSFIFHNFFLKIKQWSIAGILNHSAYKESFNGSLWSLLPELQCYCFTLIAGVFGLLDKNRVLILIITITLFLYFGINVNFKMQFGPTILILSPAMKLYTSYAAGALLYIYRDYLSLDKKGTLFLFLFTLVLIKFGGYNLTSPFLVAFNLINIFQLFKYNVKYDISYGIYIYAFPLQQLLYQVFGNKLPILIFIGFSLAITAVFGLLSYLLVEKPFINFRKKTDQKIGALVS